MGLFSRRREQRSEPMHVLADHMWMIEARDLAGRTSAQLTRADDHVDIAEAAFAEHPGLAMSLLCHGLECLHGEYAREAVSPAERTDPDRRLLAGLVESMNASLRAHPHINLHDEVRESVGHLRAIIRLRARGGADTSSYEEAITDIHWVRPAIPIDDIA